MDIKPGWYAEGRISREFAKVNCMKPRHVVENGPYKRRITASRKAKEMRASRAIFDCMDGSGFQDFGPTFTRSSVRSFYVPPECPPKGEE